MPKGLARRAWFIALFPIEIYRVILVKALVASFASILYAFKPYDWSSLNVDSLIMMALLEMLARLKQQIQKLKPSII